MKIIGSIFMFAAVLLFYTIFFKLAPAITNLIPSGDWAPILNLLIYVLIAWFGGIGVPIGLLLCGVLFWVAP